MAKAKKTEIKNKPAESGKKTGKGQKSLVKKNNQKTVSGKENGKGKAVTKKVSNEKGKSASKKISVRSEIDRLEKNNNSKSLRKSKEMSPNTGRKDAPKPESQESKVKVAKKNSIKISDKAKKNKNKNKKTADSASVKKESKKKTHSSKSTVKKPYLTKGIKENKDIKAGKYAPPEGKAKSDSIVRKAGNKKKMENSPGVKNAAQTNNAEKKKNSKVNVLTQKSKIKNVKEKSSGKSTNKHTGNADLSALQDSVHLKKSGKRVPEKHAPVLLKKKSNDREIKELQESGKPTAEILQDIVPQMKRERKIKLGETKDLWEFYSDQDGDFLAKLYTEDKLVYTQLLKIKEIKRSAKYFRNGSFIGADFIIPYDILKHVCGIAGLKAPKI